MVKIIEREHKREGYNVIEQLNEYISPIDHDWINRIKPAKEEDIEMLRKYSGMNEDIDLPKVFIEFARYAGKDDGGLLSETLRACDRNLIREYTINDVDVQNYYEEDEIFESFDLQTDDAFYEMEYYEKNPYIIILMCDELDENYILKQGENAGIYYVDFRKNSCISSSFNKLLFQSACCLYEREYYKYAIFINIEEFSYEKQVTVRRGKSSMEILKKISIENNLKCAWYNDKYFFNAYSENISINTGNLWYRMCVSGNDKQQIKKIVDEICYFTGGTAEWQKK